MRFIRATAALVVLLGLIGGVPWLLITWVGNPWPAEGVSLMSPLTDGAILGLLAVLVWLLWAQFMVCVAVESVAVIRDRHTDVHVPASFGLQGIARALVSTIALAVIALPTAASASTGGADLSGPTQDSSTSTSQTITADEDQLEDEPAADEGHTTVPVDDQVDDDAQAESGTVTVHRGDSLWALATEHLGDGDRYVEIVELNEGATMTDGSTFRASGAIQPGWVLTMPSDATGTDVAAESSSEQYEVQAGDTLSQVAQDELGDASQYPEIFEASKSISQAGGKHLSNPDHIEPGWKLNLSTSSAAEEPPVVEESPAPEPPAVDEGPADEEQAPEPAEEQAPEAEPQADSPQVANASATAQAEAEDEEDSIGGALMSRNGVGVFLAAGLIALLAARRRRQQKKRRPGQRIPKPSPAASQAEYELRSVADQQMPQLLQTMLRALGVTYAATGEALPAIRAARVSEEHVELYLSEPAHLPSPWSKLDEDGSTWSSGLEVDTAADLDAVPDPYPLLVTTGLDAENAIVLVNLEAVAPFGVSGSSVEALQVLAATAAEISTAPWAEDVRVTLVDGWHELAKVLSSDRCRYVPSLSELGERDGIEVLVVGDDVDGATADDLAETGYVVLFAGESQRWGLRVDDAQSAALTPLGLTVRPQLLTTRDYELIAEVLGTAMEQPPSGPSSVDPIVTLDVEEHQALIEPAPTAPTVTDDPPVEPSAIATTTTATLERPVEALAEDLQESDEEPVTPVSISSRTEAPADRVAVVDVDELLDTGHPVLRMMTPTFQIRDARGAETKHENLCRRIAAFMALHPSAARPQLIETIWTNRVSDSTVKSSLSRTRAWLGEHPENAERYVQGLRIDSAIVSDWTIFTEIVGDDVTRTATSDLERALALVDGRPFEGEDPETWTFVDMVSQDIIAGTVDAAYELAKRRFMEGRWRSVKHYASIAAMLEPINEYVWRLWIHACHASRDPEGLAETIDRMRARISHIGDELEPETIELLQALEDGDAAGIEESRSAL